MRELARMATQMIVQVMLFYTRIYNSIRRGYINSIRSELGRLKGQVNKDCKYDINRRASILEPYAGISVLQSIPELDIARGPVVSSSQLKNELARAEHSFIDCPLSAWSPRIRLYHRLSITILITIFIKYTLICASRQGLFSITYLCFVPGRSVIFGPLSSEYPSFNLFVCSMMLSLMIYQYFFFYELNLDTFAFLMCNEQILIEKERNLKLLNQNKSAEWAKERCIVDRMFYRCVHKVNGQLEYQLKPHRSLKQWYKLKKFIDDQWIGQKVLLLVFVAIYGVCFYYLCSSEVFAANYHKCELIVAKMQNRTDFRWSFNEPYRIVMFIFDCIDTLYLLVNISMIGLFVAETGVVITNDLEFRLQDMCIRMDQLIVALAENYYNGFLYPEKCMCELTETKGSDTDLDNRTRSLQEDLIDMFEQIASYDGFMTSFSASHIVYWIVGNIFYQIVSMTSTRTEVYVPNIFIQISQAIFFAMFSFTFYQMGLPYITAVKLYHKISRTIAYDPYIKQTLPAWISILEYYNEKSNRYSLHFFTRKFNLSFLNYIKSMTWFITCSLYSLNLVRYLIES